MHFFYRKACRTLEQKPPLPPGLLFWRELCEAQEQACFWTSPTFPAVGSFWLSAAVRFPSTMATLADVDASTEVGHASDVGGRELAETSLPEPYEGGETYGSDATATARDTWAGELPTIAISLAPVMFLLL